MKLLFPVLLASSCFLQSAEIRWTPANSPVQLSSNFEVPPNDTLVIEGGVVVQGLSQKRFIIPYENSAVRVFGNSNAPVVFIDVGIDALRQGNVVYVQNMYMTNGWIQAYGRPGSFEAIGCTLASSELNMRSETNVFVGCTFTGTTRFSDFERTRLENNLFLGWGSELIMFPVNSSIKYNTFLKTNQVVIRCGTFNIANNYWGTTTTNIIAGMIIDRSDTFSINGYATYEPILLAPHPNTPAGPVAPEPPEPPQFVIHPSVQLEFVSEPLVYYYIEGSSDFTNWTSVSGQLLGNGAVIRWYCPADTQRKIYRVKAIR